MFVLDRDTGEPIFPVQDVPVPRSDVPGEETSPTQPIPLKPPPLVRQAITEADLTNITPEAHEYALQEFRKYRSGSIYTPPSLQGTITMPGHLGGAEWQGGSFDPRLNVLYVNVNESRRSTGSDPSTVTARSGTGGARETGQLGRQIYETNCMACHGADRKGNPPQIPAARQSGPAPAGVQDGHHRRAQRHARVPPVRGPGTERACGLCQQRRPPPLRASGTTARATRSTATSSSRMPTAFPAIAPPWGTLNAIDLATGDILWKVPLGEYPELAAKGIRNTGTMNFGGAVATAGGVALHRRHRRREDPRVRDAFGARAVGISIACRRLCHSERLHGERQAICRDRRRRRRQECHEVGRFGHRLCAAGRAEAPPCRNAGRPIRTGSNSSTARP